MKWEIEVQRTSLQRRNLVDLLAGLGFSLFDDVQLPAITSHEIDQCNSAAEVFELGKKVRTALSGPARIDPEFALGSVIEYSFVPPRRHAFLEPQGGTAKATGGVAELTIGPPPGLTASALEDWHMARAEQEYQAKLEAQRTKLEPAYLEPRAAKVIEYLAVKDPGAEVLYKIYELLEGHPNNRTAFHAQFGLSAHEFRRFADSVHNPTVSGDWARHAYPDTPKTTNPMSKSEAENFVRGMADRWLAHVRAGLPP